MVKTAMLALALAAATSSLSIAAERAKARVVCKAADERLTYDCTVTLTGRNSGKPVSGAVVRVGAEMPSMPMAHNVRPVPLEPAGKPGVYKFRIALEMYGLWTLELKMSKPARDLIISRHRFTRDGAAPAGRR